MATYHLRTKVRSRNSSAISGLRHAAYLTREERPAGRPPSGAGAEHSRYVTRENSTRKDLVYAEHGNMPRWAQGDGLRFWESADEHERANGRIYREYEVSIPRELTPEQWVSLAKEFTQQTLGTRYPYTLAVHAPLARDGEVQPHFHLQFSQRADDGIDRSEELYWKRANREHPERGGVAKVRDWDTKEHLRGVRREWAELANRALERAGLEHRIDHRTLEEQARTESRVQSERELRRVDRELGDVRGEIRLEREVQTRRRVREKDRQEPRRGIAPRGASVQVRGKRFEPDLDRGEEWDERGPRRAL